MMLIAMTAIAEEAESPGMALLEFLGAGVKVEQELLDPLDMQAMEDMTGTQQAADE